MKPKALLHDFQDADTCAISPSKPYFYDPRKSGRSHFHFRGNLRDKPSDNVPFDENAGDQPNAGKISLFRPANHAIKKTTGFSSLLMGRLNFSVKDQ
jgi:hypothetical protein